MYILYRKDFILGQGYVNMSPEIVSKEEALRRGQYRNVWVRPMTEEELEEMEQGWESHMLDQKFDAEFDKINKILKP